MKNKEVQARLKIFYDKYGLNITIEAFDIRFTNIKQSLKKITMQMKLLSQNPPNQITLENHLFIKIIYDIKRLRQIYLNIGKAKLHVPLKP